MRKNYTRFPKLIIVLLFLMLNSAQFTFSQQNKLNLSSDVWPPFTDIETENAMVLDLVKEALYRCNIEVNYVIQNF